MILYFVSAYFQYGDPIYSAKAVRFRMGHSRPEPNYSPNSEADKKSPARNFGGQQAAPDDYVWTYVSPVFPMAQVISMLLLFLS